MTLQDETFVRALKVAEGAGVVLASRLSGGAIINAGISAISDVISVGMIAPRQEKFIFENRVRLNVKFAESAGAVFDFYSGNRERITGKF